ncbi:helix-turn-helix domain-containing protein [Consotaella salsifontis]|uniref:helix-turn-helix domain-containing protein n=1 Tax=Consotaella salsifontis TaxID=1365950 RepID=UPI000999AE18
MAMPSTSTSGGANIARYGAANGSRSRIQLVMDYSAALATAQPGLRIARLICLAYGVTIDDLRSHRRTSPLPDARQAISYWCRRRTGLSYAQIAKLVGVKDHTTIIHGVRQHPYNRLKQRRYLRPLTSFRV